MGVRLRSLAEDCTDAYSHTWSVAFFLILALILLLTPPPPASPSPSSSSNINSNNENKPDHHHQIPPPEFNATCWCPSQFERPHVAYTNAVCSVTFNNWIFNKPIHEHHDLKTVKSRSDPSASASAKNSDKPVEKNVVRERAREMVFGLQPPVLLFILAIVLRIPRFLWSVMSRYCNGFNVGRTLESAEKGDVMSLDGRRQMYAGLFREIQKHTRRSPKAVTGLYLFMKAVMILVLVAEILVVTVHVLPQLRHDDPGVVAAARHEKTDSDSVANVTVDNDKDDNKMYYRRIKDLLPQRERFELLSGLKDGAIFFCYFRIRQRGNFHDYTTLCLVQRKQQLELEQQQPQQQHQDRDGQALFLLPLPLIQSNVFLIVLVSLVFLLIFNVVSALSWLAVLANQSTRTGLGLRPDSPLDLVFLLQMARDNLSVGVTTGLVYSVLDEESTKGCEDDMALVQKIL